MIADDDAAKPTGVAIAVGLADPIFLARELGLTSPGRVPTQFLEAGGLDLGSPEPPQFPFKLAVTSPRAFTVEEQRAMNEAFSFDLHPRLSPPSALLMAAGLTDQAASLVWAGDLDHDGKLDFYLILSQLYNIRSTPCSCHPALRSAS